MKNKIVGVWSLLAFGFAIFTASVGQSTTLPGTAGHAWVSSDESCFGSSWSSMVNNCSGSARKRIIPIQSTANGSVTFKASGPFSGSVCLNDAVCRAVVTDNNNGFINQTSAVAACGLTTLGTLTVASTSVVHYDCDFASGASLYSLAF